MSIYQPLAPAGSSNDIQLNLNGGFGVVTGFSWVSGELQVPGDIRLNDGGTFTTTLQCVAPTANRTQTFPDATGTVALVAGSSGQLMFNNAGALGGLPSLTADAQNNLTFSQLWIQSTNGAASAPAHALTGTWFTGGTSTTTKPQLLIEPAGTTSNSWSTAGTGLGVNAASGFTGNLLDLQVNGTRNAQVSSNGDCRFGAFGIYAYSSGFVVTTNAAANAHSGYWGSDKLQVAPTLSISWGSANGYDIPSLVLARDADNILAQRNGTNAQTSRIYNTYTSATNNELAKLSWSSNVFQLGTEKGSAGGTARAMELQTDGTARIRIGAAGELGFFGAAAVAQPASVADATDNASAITQLNLALARLRSLGLIAT